MVQNLYDMSSRTHVRDLVVKSVEAKGKGKISLFVRNDRRCEK
jgi:hypothetical protein